MLAWVFGFIAVAVVIGYDWLRRALIRLEKREAELDGKSTAVLQALIRDVKSKEKARTKSSLPVAIVTGANSGIGFALATKLLSIGFEVVLACRNAGRGKAAKDAILKIVGSEHSDRLHLLLVDVASVQSVASFCDTFQTQFDRLDFLFFNAGILNINGFNWWSAISSCFTGRFIAFMETGRRNADCSHFLVQKETTLTPEGVEDVFATHVLGHFAMYRMLYPLLRKSGGRIVWTGSRAASRCALKLPGLPAPTLAHDPYASAKCAQDLLSFAIDQKCRSDGVRSAIICPGFVDTDVAPGFFRIFRGILVMMRPVWLNFQVTPARGCAILYHVAAMPEAELCGGRKYVMKAGRVGVAANGNTEVDHDAAKFVYEYCEGLLSQITSGKKSGQPATHNSS